MESPRISVARALELGVRVSWREAVAIVQEAVARTAVTGGATPTRVTAESCLLTRGGDVVLTGTAVEAGPEAVVRLLDDLLASCINPGRFSGAVANGTALEMIEELRDHTTAKRRRVEVASVALRGLAAQADAARAMADAAEQDPAADVDDFIAPATPAASPTAFPRRWGPAPAPLWSRAAPDIASPRISLARVLELGVRVSWREASAIVHEAVARTAATESATPTRVTAGSCLLTRAGDVLLTGTATQAGPEAVVRLLDDLLASCSNPDAFSAAVANGTALDMIDELGQHTTAQRRRAEVASVALRGLAAESAAAGAMAGAAERDPAADFDDFFAAPTPAASPTDWPWSSVTALAPPAAIPMLDDQTDARLGDSAVGDAEVRRPGRDEVAPVSLRELVAAANAAAGVARAMADADEQHPSADVGDAIGAPAASPTELSWPSVTALATPSAIPMLDDQTVARLGDSAVGDAKVRMPGLDEVASVALRELVAAANAAADATRATADAAEQDPAAAFDDFIAAPTPAASPTAFPWPSDTPLAPLSAISPIHDQVFALDHEDPIAAGETAGEWTAPDDDLPGAEPPVNPVWAASYARDGYPSPFTRVKRASPAALVYSVLALAAGGLLGLQLPETQWSAVEPSEPSEPAIEPPELGATVGIDRQTPLARPDPVVLPEVVDPPSVPALVARSAPRESPKIEDRRAPLTRAQESLVRSMPPPAARPETPAANTATVAGSRSLPTASAADAVLAPAAANAAAAPLPAADLSSVVASPSATASAPAEIVRAVSTEVPVDAAARSPSRELEARAIENVLGRYRTAFNKLDAGAAVAVWPTVNEKTLARAFERLESHDLSFENCQIEVFAGLAEAACSGSARYVPKVGSRTPKDEARRWRFSLRKASGGWLIDRVDAR